MVDERKHVARDLSFSCGAVKEATPDRGSSGRAKKETKTHDLIGGRSLQNLLRIGHVQDEGRLGAPVAGDSNNFRPG